MSLSKRAFGQIIMASAASDSPIDDEVLQEIAIERGDNPDKVVDFHRSQRERHIANKNATGGPMPMA